jgi:hypothetical protein
MATDQTRPRPGGSLCSLSALPSHGGYWRFTANGFSRRCESCPTSRTRYCARIKARTVDEILALEENRLEHPPKALHRSLRAHRYPFGRMARVLRRLIFCDNTSRWQAYRAPPGFAPYPLILLVFGTVPPLFPPPSPYIWRYLVRITESPQQRPHLQMCENHFPAGDGHIAAKIAVGKFGATVWSYAEGQPGSLAARGESL